FHGKVVVEAARALQHASGNLVSVFLIDSTAWTGTFHGIRQTALRNLRRTWRGISTGPADDTPYTKSLSASLRDSWRLLQWLLAQAPPGMKRRLNSPLTKSRSSDSVALLSLRANQRWRWDDRT